MIWYHLAKELFLVSELILRTASFAIAFHFDVLWSKTGIY